jgi:hypothetical protein
VVEGDALAVRIVLLLGKCLELACAVDAEPAKSGTPSIHPL